MSTENTQLTPADKIITFISETLKNYADVEPSQFTIVDPLTAEEYAKMTAQEHLTLHFKWLSVSEEYCHSQHRCFDMPPSITKFIIYDIKKQAIYKECIAKSEIAECFSISEKYVDYLLRIGIKVCFASKALGNKYRIFKQNFILRGNEYIAVETPKTTNDLKNLKRLIEGKKDTKNI